MSVVTPGPHAVPLDRDTVTAGLVLLRAVLADPAPPAECWYTVREFHAVLAPLLAQEIADVPEETRRALLRAGRIRDGGALLWSVADKAEKLDGVLDGETILGLAELADGFASAAPAPPPAGTSTGTATDVVVQGPDGGFVVLAAHEDGSGHSWSAALSDDVRWAVDRALAGTLEDLLTEWSPADPGESYRVRWAARSLPDARLAAAALALAQLGRISGLGEPGPLLVGDLDHDRCGAPDDTTVNSLASLATEIGRDLLIPGPHCWQHWPAGGGPATSSDAPPTLDGAAEVVWGEDWRAWKRRRYAAELAASGWTVVDWRHRPESQLIADHPVQQVSALKHHLIASERAAVAALGGIPGSGRSAIVRLLASDLATRKKSWVVQVIRAPHGELPEPNAATTAGRYAFGMLEPCSQRRLLVFEDLQPMRRGDAGEMLAHVARHLPGTSVLGVLQYDENSRNDWDTDTLFVVTGVVRRRAVEQFVTDLSTDPDLDPAPARAALARNERISLRDLTLLMSGAADPGAELVDRFQELAQDERAPVLRAAAASLVSVDTDAQELALLNAADRRTFGVVGGRAPDTVRISADISRRILDEGRRERDSDAPTVFSTLSGVLNGEIIELLRPRLDVLLEDGDPRLVELLLGARLHHGALCAGLLSYADEAGLLSGWEALAPTGAVARSLEVAELMPADAPERCAETLIRRLEREPPAQTPAELLTIAHRVYGVAADLDADVITDFVGWLVQTVDLALVRQTGRPDERLTLLMLIEQFDADGDSRSMLAERALNVIAELPGNADDYRLVRRVDKFHRRVSRRVDAEALVLPIEAEPAVEALLVREPAWSDSVEVLIEAMTLRQQLAHADWEVDLPEYQRFLTAAMSGATAGELTRAINGVRSCRPQFGTRLLGNWTGFADQVRLVLRRSSATDAAGLLQAIVRSNNLVAGRVLRGTDMPALAARLADRGAPPNEAKEILSDAKGIGRLLTVTGEIDELFHDGIERFATQLVEHLDQDRMRRLLEQDPRTSVRYHLIRGVWDAEASYRDRLVDTVVDVVVESVLDGRNHWGPEIGLRVAADMELGSRIIEALRARVPAKAMLDGMTSCGTAHGRAVFHRLGRFLHPAIPAQFLLTWDVVSFAERLTSPSPSAALEVCVEAANTLTEADVPAAGRLILTETGGSETWAARLAFGGRPEPFADALSRISALDRGIAGEVVHDLAERPTRRRIDDQPVGVLAARLRAAYLHGPGAVAAVLDAVHGVVPDVARELVATLAEDKHAMGVFRFEMQQLQDPTLLWRVTRSLARCGVTRRTENTAWIDAIYETRIKVLHRFFSPRAVLSFLKTLSTWDEQWGVEAVGQLDLVRIGARVRRSRRDVSDAVELVRVLGALEQRAAASQLLGEITAHDMREVAIRSGLETVCDVLDLVEDLRPEDLPRVANALCDAIERFVGRPAILNGRRHWLQVGLACAAVADLGPLPHIDDPTVRPSVVHAPEVAWAAVGVGRPEWGDNALGRVEARLRDRPPRQPTGQACLLAATASGWAPDLRDKVQDWDVSEAPLRVLRQLYRDSAGGDDMLASIMTAATSALRTRVNHQVVRADWDAYRLRLSLSAANADAATAMEAVYHKSLGLE